MRLYACAGAALVGLSAWTANVERWNAVPWTAACLLGASAVVFGLRVHRPRRRGFWIGIGLAEALWMLAGVVQLVAGQDVSSSMFGADSLLWVCGYVGLAAAAVILLRTTRGARPSLLDTAICGSIAVAILWPLGLHLARVQGTASAIAGSLYPALDLVLSLLLLRIALSPWVRLRALRLITLAVAAATVTDIAYSSLLFPSPLAARIMSSAYTVVYLLLGAAALHPSMRRLPPREVRDDVRSNRRTLLVVAVALCAAPLAFGVTEVLAGDVTGAALAALTLATVCLVIVRVGALLRQLNGLRTRAEESERLFRLVFDAAGIGISVGADGIMSRTNAALHRILGYSADELAESHFTRFVHPDDRPNTYVPRPGEVTTFRRRYVHKNGRTVWTEVTLTAPEDNSFGIAVIDDVTGARRLEEDLRHAQKMEAVGQLAGGIAHDFNNLMMAVSGYAGLLQRELAVDDPRRERVHAIAAAAGRATELTRKLLAFSRRQVLRLAPADLAEVAEEIEPILRGLLPETIVLDLDLQRGAVARVDRGELEQVLINLALNARDAMEDGGLLRVRVRHDGETVELAVSDTGVGIGEETRSRIFDPFFTTKPVGKGTGLGLSTVDGIVGQLGGTIDVETERGRGTTFTIRLPFAPDASFAGEPQTGADEAAAPQAGRVLLVEDEEIVRHVTQELLARAGYDVAVAASAEDALLLLADGERPDVLVSDVVMTGMDGPTLVDRARLVVPGLPVLFVSGYPAESLRDRTGETILTKPFTPAELAEGIESVRRGSAVPA